MSCLWYVTNRSTMVVCAEYQAALKLVAEKKGIEFDALVSKILAAGGPGSSGTKADNVKFHDDKSLYTGAACFTKEHLNTFRHTGAHSCACNITTYMWRSDFRDHANTQEGIFGKCAHNVL